MISWTKTRIALNLLTIQPGPSLLKNERGKEINYRRKNQYVLTGGSSSSGTTGGVSEVSPISVKARVAEIEKGIGLSKRKYTPMPGPKPEDVPLMIPNGKELVIVS